ncbi:MAG: aldehyde ferredoxin oxidoreductase [Firmicutes bacterium]|nr:aldehyde ferredoxin oxidoreductase [Bacillota bacterium]
MTTQTVATSKLPVQYQLLGGRSLTSQICHDEVKPLCYPLGADNKLIIAPGLLASATASSAGRISMGAKSPLTQGITASNGGGITATQLSALGIGAIIVEGIPVGEELCILLLEQDKAQLVPAPELAGKGTYETAAVLQRQYGHDVAVACIGPAGEMLMTAATINNVDVDGQASRICGRGGLGAVMGSKRIKAIVVKNTSEPTSQIEDEESFAAALTTFNALLQDTMTQPLGEAEKVLHERCLPGCVTTHAMDSTLQRQVAPIKPGTAKAFRECCGIDDWQELARLNDTANDIGVDTFEVAAALGIFMDADVIGWADGQRAYTLLQEVREGTSLGHILGQGSQFTATALGVQGSPAQRNKYTPDGREGVFSFEREDTGFCVTTTLQNEKECNQLYQLVQKDDIAGGLPLITNQMLDTVGVCLYSAATFLTQPKAWTTMAALLSAQDGGKWTSETLLEQSRLSLQTEYDFNQAAGYCGDHNALSGYPAFAFVSPLPDQIPLTLPSDTPTQPNI